MTDMENKRQGNIEQARAAADKWVQEMRAIYPQADPWTMAHASFLAGSAFKPGDVWASS